MYEGIKILEEEKPPLQKKVEQEQLLQLLGQIMKQAINISSFEEFIEMVTKMLIGGMGISNYYIWTKVNDERLKKYRFFMRTKNSKGKLKVINQSVIPSKLMAISKTQLGRVKDVSELIIEDGDLPFYRLVIPIKDLSESEACDFLIVEHEESEYFNSSVISFFETLSVFIACKAVNLKLLKNVSEKSIKDPLTGAYNRRHLKDALENMYEKYGQITVAVIDTDNFKLINDALGHTEGDTVLKAIAQLAKGSVKESGGEVVRYGGDEFVIIIPKSLGESLHILETFRKSIHYLKIAYDLEADISVTLGVCSCPEIIEDYKQIIKVADRALLRGKVKGKNRVVLASEEDIGVN